jgi:ArsR family transcriptional regulator
MTTQTKPAGEVILAELFDLLSQPARIQILLVIREEPACVCHLMAALGMRQASISQHLMALRKAGWVNPQRDGRNIYYSLADQRLVELIQQAAAISGVSLSKIDEISRRPLDTCPCPKCHPELPPEYSCKYVPVEYQKKSQVR